MRSVKFSRQIIASTYKTLLLFQQLDEMNGKEIAVKSNGVDLQLKIRIKAGGDFKSLSMLFGHGGEIINMNYVGTANKSGTLFRRLLEVPLPHLRRNEDSYEIMESLSPERYSIWIRSGREEHFKGASTQVPHCTGYRHSRQSRVNGNHKKGDGASESTSTRRSQRRL